MSSSSGLKVSVDSLQVFESIMADSCPKLNLHNSYIVVCNDGSKKFLAIFKGTGVMNDVILAGKNHLVKAALQKYLPDGLKLHDVLINSNSHGSHVAATYSRTVDIDDITDLLKNL